MRSLIVLLAGLVLAVGVRAQGDFTGTLTPAERAAAGLDKLTPEELARLKAIVERYKSGEVAVVQQQAEAQVATVRQEAHQKVEAAEAKVREVEQKSAAAPESPKAKVPAWVGALAILKRTGDAPNKAEAVESRIEGEFTGWRRGTVFKLENGQVWQQAGSDDYVGVRIPSPKVRVFPGMLGSYWMEIEGVRPHCKVKPLKLE